MRKTNKRCVICGKEYYFCSGCPGKSPAYMLSFCSKNCQNIYDAVAGYEMKTLSKEDAQNMLLEADLSKLEEFRPNIRESITEILTPEAKPVAAAPVKPVEIKAEPKPEVKAEEKAVNSAPVKTEPKPVEQPVKRQEFENKKPNGNKPPYIKK